VDGRKQGCVKKHYGTAKARVAISRREIAKQFVDLVEKDLAAAGNLPEELRNILKSKDSGADIVYR
jgi:hypothetical protein